MYHWAIEGIERVCLGWVYQCNSLVDMGTSWSNICIKDTNSFDMGANYNCFSDDVMLMTTTKCIEKLKGFYI